MKPENDRSSISSSQNPTLDSIENSADRPLENNIAPLVSFGIPVRNVEKCLPKVIDSLLAQDLSNLEVVICDNESNDRTQAICEEYSHRDARVRYHRNPENIGQVDNFNKVLELSKGKYFRWIGADDWLEPDYARQCVELLEAHPEAIGVTTYQDHIDDDGTRHYKEYQGERLESPLPHQRFCRLICFFTTADFSAIDPIYTMMRRDALMHSHRLQFVPSMDQVLALELSLSGPFLHIPVCLSHRRREFFHKTTREAVYRRFHPTRYKEFEDPHIRAPLALLPLVWAAPMGNWEKILCLKSVVRYAVVRRGRRVVWFLRPLPGRVLRSLIGWMKKNNGIKST